MRIFFGRKITRPDVQHNLMSILFFYYQKPKNKQYSDNDYQYHDWWQSCVIRD